MAKQTRKGGTGIKGAGARWYGENSDRGHLVYADLETRYTEVFDALRQGSTVPGEKIQSDSIPDLRTLLIDYGKYRIKQEFAEDQHVRKFYALIPELNKSLNLILEKVNNFGLVTGIGHGSEDPCTFFSRIKGMDLPEDISLVLDRISESADSICSLRGYLLSFLSEKVRVIMPNTTELVGEEVALELLFHAGSLRSLALMPASAIQVIGAEKALFKHIMQGSPPPKHGVLFKVKGMSAVRTSDRGRIARFISGKVAIALRADYAGTRLDLTEQKELINERLGRKKTKS